MWKLAFKRLLFAALLLVPCTALAHDARPLFVHIDELGGEGEGVHRYTMKLQVPPTVEAGNQPFLLLPKVCTAKRMGIIAQLKCNTPLTGETLTIGWPQHNPSISTLIRVSLASGVDYQQLLAPGENTWQVPAERTSLEVVSEYSVLGIEHILIGWDHLLFLLCLIFIAGSFKRILITISGFTVAHSLTLVLTTLGLIRLPIAPVEAGIALSILFLATEIIRDRRDTLAWRYPVAVSTLFGFIHGFGFASVLQEIGLPRNDLGLSLLFFNIGVEVGQILFVAAVMATFAMFKRVKAVPLAGIQAVIVYGAGSLAAFWTIERVSGF